MGKKLVVALGGNALGNNLPEQMEAVAVTASAIVDLIEEGNEVVIAHGNGPQVGMIQNAMIELMRAEPEKYGDVPLSVCTAMSQGYIGYDLQNRIREELRNRGIDKQVAMLLTQVEVDPHDPAFDNPTKPIGTFLSKEEAEHLEEKGYKVVEDAGRGYRRVVASPMPVSIVEIETIRTLVDAGEVVIACGGGGVPVYKTTMNHLKGAGAVIDKDFAAECMAEALDADMLIILTAVENAVINYKTPNAKKLGKITASEARKHMEAGEFAAGSMLPKMGAAVRFAESKDGRVSVITLLTKAKEGVEGKTGTIITK